MDGSRESYRVLIKSTWNRGGWMVATLLAAVVVLSLNQAYYEKPGTLDDRLTFVPRFMP